ncbi:hypothetical protein [Epilithonimonas hungarica]|uniref:Uncharacterized protein n=1 Tax=Epilithonimonas hungarica TaxID=454006 RepID=A0A1G7NX18_9FLAO|nr:hypothetical protein [Epilithonimonas hungarica]MDP9957301.1 hypothetical protein [Epilithonimonas hungarica]MPT33351.1 hypothetical protein [Chryseobacterium sp.]SDF78437.1 hypothetical protein SAMN05421825_2117 [Epilithonimonas hungarica]
MSDLTFEKYNLAIDNWNLSKSNYSDIQSLISPQKVFTLFPDQIDWLANNNETETYFRLDIGVQRDELILILAPRTTFGDIKILDHYEYAPLGFLENDLTLTQTKTYTMTNNYILSKDLTKHENDTDVSFPILQQPVTAQQIAVDEIESWRENGMDWLSLESNEFNGERIFQSFYVPKADLLQNQDDATSIVCAFGLKYSPVYQRLLPTLIFISCFDDPSLKNVTTKLPSNTYDWSRPYPPYTASTIG